MLSVGDPIEVGSHGICVIRDFGLIGKTRFVKARIVGGKKLVFVPVSRDDRLLVNDAMFTAEFEATYRQDEVRWGDTIECRIPARPRSATHAA